MSARTQFPLDTEMQRLAEAKAAALGLSFADYVATLVAHDIEDLKSDTISDNGEPFDISEMFDLGSSDEPTDIARDKDKLVGEAALSQYRSKSRPQPEQ